MHLVPVILDTFGPLHVRSGDALPYLTLAYTLFFVAIFAYVISLSRRQNHAQAELALLRQAVEEEKQAAHTRD